MNVRATSCYTSVGAIGAVSIRQICISRLNRSGPDVDCSYGNMGLPRTSVLLKWHSANTHMHRRSWRGVRVEDVRGATPRRKRELNPK